ncbi:hypothetical protein Tco_0766362 [Tanacetum coccineum]
MPRKEKDLGSFTLPCYINNVFIDNALPELGASISVMPILTYLNLGLGELVHTKLTVELADKTVKYPKGIVENILVGIEARLMGETLVINRSLDPLIGDYIKLNDLNEPLELRRNQVNDLIPTVEEGEVIDAPMDDLVETRNDELDTRIDDYPRALMNVPIIVGTFSVIADFAVLEDRDAFRDKGMANGVPTDGPYQTNPPFPDDSISYIRIDREGQVCRIRHEEEIDVHEYQILTREIVPTLVKLCQPWKQFGKKIYVGKKSRRKELEKDRGTRRGRHSTSSSTFDQPSSSHLNYDDDDGNDEGTSRASTPSPTLNLPTCASLLELDVHDEIGID